MGPGARGGDKASKMPVVFQLLNSILATSIQTKSVTWIHAKIVLKPHSFCRKLILSDFSVVQVSQGCTPAGQSSLCPLFWQRPYSTGIIPPGNGSTVLYRQILPGQNFLLQDAEWQHGHQDKMTQKMAPARVIPSGVSTTRELAQLCSTADRFVTEVAAPLCSQDLNTETFIPKSAIPEKNTVMLEGFTNSETH